MHNQHLLYKERAALTPSPLGARLFKLLDDKRTNLAFSADVTRASDLLMLAELLGPAICVLKTHIDIIEDFTPALTEELKRLARQYDFLLFEDRKFADIGNTVKHQYQGGCYHIADWADIVNAHSLPGPGIIKALSEVGQKQQRGLLMLAEMSSAGHLMGPDYIKQTLHMAEQYPEFVIGFITQHAVSPHPQWINMTPGIKLQTEGDPLGQQYITPEKAVLENGTDIIIVGRGILSAADPLAEAAIYREHGWNAYKKRTSREPIETS